MTRRATPEVEPLTGPADAPAWEGPLFIVGMPRSGTKLLRNLLIQHSRIRIPYIETEFLTFLVAWVAGNGEPCSEAAFGELFERLSRSTYFDYRLKLEPAFDARAWRMACDGRFDAAGLFEGFLRYELGATRGSGVIWGDKSPGYVRHVPLLLRLFPQAKVVHIVRDVRDYVLSMHNAWGKDMHRAAFRWGRDVMAAHRCCAENPQRCLEVRYETLLNEPESLLGEICNFIGVPFEAAMTRLDRPSENLGAAKGQVGIVRDNLHKYRAKLSARQIAGIESLAFQSMTAMGYRAEEATAARELSPLKLRWLQLKDGWSLLRRDADRRGLLGSLRFYLSHQLINRGSK